MTQLDGAFLLLVFLQLKHWYIDFVNQDMEEVNHKGIFMSWLGMKHSVKQGFGTYIAIALLLFMALPAEFDLDICVYALCWAFIDFVFHYLIDWVKMNYGNRDIQTSQFWAHLGLDQMAHQLTYLMITYGVILI